ncbi:Molybdenum cofactor biosynthesis protein 1 [Zalerion maritima]|uniref:Molybdenum cofactor biosynthesis protein 1 n=1 Tax=Zalerion maritima TaxID=339359 RepID=A0AAD5RH92_9PEZI|nr:Molybdenum cofactor biosynthesis protein 1 [Zalerion maritima]
MSRSVASALSRQLAGSRQLLRKAPQLQHSHKIATRRAIATGASSVAQQRPESPAPVPPVVPPPAVENPGVSPVYSPSPRRVPLIKDAKPFSDFLTDNFNRQHDYLRISLTEKCNLRCMYCMPEEGVPLSPDQTQLTTPEVYLLASVFVAQGVTKIRLTGGEPTVRKDIIDLVRQIGSLRKNGLKEICITTNGVSLHRKLDSMVEAGLTGINLSLDTMDPFQFQLLTRRSGFEAVKRSIKKILEMNKAGAGIKFKINCVVMRGINDREILDFVNMTEDEEVEVRFIEYMPFDGNKWSEGKMVSFKEMLRRIREEHPSLEKVQDHPNDTSKTFRVPGFAGKVGFITSMTHNFCGTCNRLRVTSDGNLKVCLFGNAEVSLRDIIRKSNGGEPIDAAAFQAMRQAAIEAGPGLSASLELPPNEQELLDVIGMAVKRKKEKHAGIGELEHMKNRPMILIEPSTTTSTPHHLASAYCPSSVVAPMKSATTTRMLEFSSSFRTDSLPSVRLMSTTRILREDDGTKKPGASKLTHVSDTGSAHMVAVSDKDLTKRVATAVCSVRFTSDIALRLIRDNQMKKGDVLGVARVAGIMASKRTPDLIPLCHPIAISHVSVEVEPSSSGGNKIDVVATVTCDGKTGVEMEALTAASMAALTVYDMCKAVDKGMVVEGLKVILKEGGKSGRWADGQWKGDGQ